MTERNDEGRLFVPLSSEPYAWFEEGSKKWEVRRYGSRFTERYVVPGRRVELRRGYSSAQNALWGTIREVVWAEGLSDLFAKVPYAQVLPTANNVAEAIDLVSGILTIDPTSLYPLLAFRVELD